jgi:hypothetical protein
MVRGGLVALAAGAAAAVALFAGGSGGGGQAGAQGVPPALSGQLEVFRRERSLRDEMPGNPAHDPAPHRLRRGREHRVRRPSDVALWAPLHH